MSIIDPTTCGFAKVVAYELVLSRVTLKEQIDCYDLIFNKHFMVSSDIHRRNFPKIKNQIQSIAKSSKTNKNTILESFSSKSWHKLGGTEKSQHSFSNCKGCIKSKIYKHLLTLFPVKCITYGRKAALTLYQSGEEKSKMVADAKILLKKADNEFKKKFPFTPIECLVPSIPKSSLVAKPSKSVVMAQKNSYARSFKSSIDAHLQETAVDRLLFI